MENKRKIDFDLIKSFINDTFYSDNIEKQKEFNEFIDICLESETNLFNSTAEALHNMFFNFMVERKISVHTI